MLMYPSEPAGVCLILGELEFMRRVTTSRLAHSLIRSRPTRPPTHSRIHSLTLTHPSLNRSVAHSLTHSFTTPITHSLTQPLTQSLTHSLTSSLAHALPHSPSWDEEERGAAKRHDQGEVNCVHACVSERASERVNERLSARSLIAPAPLRAS